MSSASTFAVTLVGGYPLSPSLLRSAEGSHRRTATHAASYFLRTSGRRCPKSTTRDGLDFTSSERRFLVSTSTAALGASELIEIAGNPRRVATLGAMVFFPVPGVPQIPTIPRTSARRRGAVKNAPAFTAGCFR